MKINENTKWGEVDKDLEFLDHPAFPKPDVYKTRQKPRVAVMGYNKDDIPGGDIEPKYTAAGEINPFHMVSHDIQPSYNEKKDKWEPEGVVEEPSYTDVIYQKYTKADADLKQARLKIEALTKELEETKKNLARLWGERK